MTETPHCFLHASSAEHLAQSVGLEICDTSFFITEHRKNQLARVQAKPEQAAVMDHSDDTKIGGDKKGTVGAVVLDMAGNLAGT